MNASPRRRFLTSLAVGGIAAVAGTANRGASGATGQPSAVPMLHVTDLFRPHNDPDDHWDLACVYALAGRGRVELRAILTDYPPPALQTDPDVLGVAQLNYLTGQAVPVIVGSPQRMRSRDDAQRDALPSEDGGIRALLRVLRDSPRPVVISVLGSCNDVAVAGRRDPRLFAKKCAAIYLNAGTGTPDRVKASQLEYNVSLNPAAYAAIFDLPCPLYWMPCWEELPTAEPGSKPAREYGTYYRFRQGDVLPSLSAPMQNYFAYMYQAASPEARTGRPGCNWLRYLRGPRDEALLTRQAALDRSMWCTGGFLHAAGLTVARDGRIMPRGASEEDAVYGFDPIQVRCSAEGVTEWLKVKTPRRRFIFRVRDPEAYPAAMATAMKTLLQGLG